MRVVSKAVSEEGSPAEMVRAAARVVQTAGKTGSVTVRESCAKSGAAGVAMRRARMPANAVASLPVGQGRAGVAIIGSNLGRTTLVSLYWRTTGLEQVLTMMGYGGSGA